MQLHPTKPHLRLFKNLWVRKDRHDDRDMINECLDVYKHFTFTKKSRVLDLGVNVGGFAAIALKQPIAAYEGVEADPENLEIAKLNIERNNPHGVLMHLFSGAASASRDPSLMFYQTESGNAKCSGSIILTTRNAHHRKVRYEVINHNIDDLITELKPTIVKMDIEGAEYDWLESVKGKMPKCIDEIAFDLHGVKGIERFEREWLPTFLKDFDIISIQANTAFEGNKALKWEFPGFGIKGKGHVFALDVFFRRKK